ncbi:AraC family ligand binding domain-containing protein [Desulfospira joergensenii]|uniref:AraC family ligand binding domain-containing protein n=1 Tax=Desulfospira joergensenii TaxID=53329 RepID=UPI000A045992|nr:AraC family ligand binding domain-containing protein [Desulfospira joergensenii]
MDKTRIIRNRHLPFMEIKTGAETAYSVKKHSHEELSLGFVEKGSSTILCRSLELKLQIDDVVLIPPRTVHLCQPSDPDLFRFTMVFLDPHWLQKSFGLTVHGIRGRRPGAGNPGPPVCRKDSPGYLRA